MRKWILLLVMALLVPFAVKSWALPDQASPQEYTGSQTIKTSSGSVFMVAFNYSGVTVGDKVQLLDTPSTTRLTCIAGTTTGQCSVPLTVAAYFGTSIYLKETKAGGGNFYTDVQFF